MSFYKDHTPEQLRARAEQLRQEADELETLASRKQKQFDSRERHHGFKHALPAGRVISDRAAQTN